MTQRITFLTVVFILLGASISAWAQTNKWTTQYVTLDDAVNGTGDQTSSVAVVGPNRFVALVTLTPVSSLPEDLFNPPGNYLVGYWDADSVNGRVPSPINKEMKEPDYNIDGQFTDWVSGLDEVQLAGAWQLAAGPNNYIYVANNDDEHNILVFEISESGVVSTDFRMTTGTEDIFAIEVDTAGYVYVVDYEGRDDKTDEVKVFAPIGAPGTTWGDFGGHNDEPVATIDLPAGTYQGVTVSSDGSQLFVSSALERSLWKFTGDPENGYTQDTSFEYVLSAEDDGGEVAGTPTILGLSYFDDQELVFAAIDTFRVPYDELQDTYGRIYVIDGQAAVSIDTIDVAEWNFMRTGQYSTGSINGRAGGFASLVDLDVEATEAAVYTQTYYGWAVEKWMFDGVVSVEEISETVPKTIALKQNYPNPFNPNTTIEFDVAAAAHVTLEVYNLIGQRVATLIDRQLAPGTYKATFDARNLTSGVYFYKLTAGDFTSVRKMALTR